MRLQAVAPMRPTRGGAERADREGRELTRACVPCTKHEFAIDGLTQAVARLRRGAAALRDENAELRAELSHHVRHRRKRSAKMTSARQSVPARGQGVEAPRRVEPLQADLLRRVPAVAGEVAGMRAAVVSSAGACGFTTAAQVDIAVAVGEACGNVVMHAYVDAAASGSLIVASAHVNGELVVAVHDEGRGMLSRPDSPGLRLGLSLIGQLAQRVEISANGAAGTEARMSFVAAAAALT